MKKGLLYLLLLVIFFVPLLAQAADSEQNQDFSKLAMSDLMIGLGTRATAMGSMGVAITNDLSSLYWNPAGLTHLQSTEVEFLHNSWMLDTGRETLLFGLPVTQTGRLAAGISYLGLGTIEQTKMAGDGTIELTSNTLALWSLGAQVGWGMQLTPSLTAGGTVKFNMQELGVTQAMAVAADVGAQYRINKNVIFGLALKNLGPGVNGFSLPMEAVAGAAYQWHLSSQHQLTLGLDGEIPIMAVSQTLLHTGVEYAFANIVAVRLGYQLSDLNSLGGINGLSAGLGLTLGAWRLGYTFAPFGDLGSSHRLSLGLNLNAMQSTSEKTKHKKVSSSRITASGQTRLPLLQPKMSFNAAKPSGFTGGGNAVEGIISQEEAKMRSLMTGGVKVEPKIRKTMEDGRPSFQVELNISRSSGAKISRWSLAMKNNKDKVIRKLTGPGLPKKILWDGKDGAGKTMEGGTFSYQLVLTDINGENETEKGRIILGGTPVSPLQGAGSSAPISKTMEPVVFELNRAEITPQGAAIITEAAQLIRQHPGAKVYIEGYADPNDETAEALVLSRSRAEAVARYLTAYHKISMRRILLRGRGTKQPKTIAGKVDLPGHNRLVVITIKSR